MRALLTMAGRLAGMVLPLLLGIGVGRLVSPYLPLVTAWVETLGVWAPVAYVGAYVLAVVLMLPAFLLIMAGGAIFGVAKGTLLALAGATVGGTLAFLLGRTVLRGWVARKVAAHPTLSVIDRAVGVNGLRLMVLMRLSPAVPFVLSNYALGVTQVRLRDFVVAMAAMTPIIASYSAFGRAGASPAAGGALPPWVLWTGVAATVGLGALVARITQRALQEAGQEGAGRKAAG
jgi:uncharacterized membrane protein YdjX (TVP38/TMEM64 family)